MAMETRCIETTEFPRLRGYEAVEALCYYIIELEEERGKELTDKQTTAMIKLMKRLISSIEAEERFGTSDKRMRLVIQLKKTVTDIPEYPPIPLKLR